MWTLLLAFACSEPVSTGLPPEGVEAKKNLAQALKSRDPSRVEQAAESAANWENLDSELDHLLGDALANVLMHVEAGLSLLKENPDPANPAWQEAFLLATARSGDIKAMTQAWSKAGHSHLDFSNPVVPSMVQRLKTSPKLGLAAFEQAIETCMLIDAQPPVGRSALEYPVTEDLLQVAPWVGADAVFMARPRSQIDPDPTLGTGPIQCAQKIVLSAWPKVVSTTLTVALSSGNRRVFIDIKQSDDEQWSYATSDPIAGGHWIQAMHLASTPDAEKRIRARFTDGLWAEPKTDGP